MGPALPQGVVSLSPACIVSDLDRTLTDPQLVPDPEAFARIAALRRRGIRVVIATGRRLDELVEMGIPERVDGIVAENGAIILVSSENVQETRHADFAEGARRALGDIADKFHWGSVVGSGPREYVFLAMERLMRAGVAHSTEFNAQEVMILPPDVNKATGSEACLRHMGLQAADAWGIGDGENDVALLRWASVGAAPGNAAKAARDAADVLLTASYSKGFLELTQPLVLGPVAPATGETDTVTLQPTDASGTAPRPQ